MVNPRDLGSNHPKVIWVKSPPKTRTVAFTPLFLSQPKLGRSLSNTAFHQYQCEEQKRRHIRA